VAGGQEAKAEIVLGILQRRREERERAEARSQAARDALASIPEEAPADSMLDFYNSLAGAVRGRLDGADTMLKVRDALADLFQHFDLSPTPEGILIRPVLSADTAERILAGVEDWPEDGLRFGHAELEREPHLGALIGFAEPEEAALLEDADFEAQPLMARERAPIVPPLRPIHAPSGLLEVSQA
jgi:hypothetical protein